LDDSLCIFFDCFVCWLQEVEVRRRRKISTLFTELSDLLDCGPTDKASILSIATRFIRRAKSKGVKTHKSDLMIYSNAAKSTDNAASISNDNDNEEQQQNDSEEEEEEEATAASAAPTAPSAPVAHVAKHRPTETSVPAVGEVSTSSSAMQSASSSPKPLPADPLSLLSSAMAASRTQQVQVSDGEKPFAQAM
jgi:hypothetical protein